MWYDVTKNVIIFKKNLKKFPVTLLEDVKLK